MNIKDILGKKMLYCDGAMGTMLQEEGLQAGDTPEHWNIERPEVVLGIHKRYLDSGANIVTANTFGANRLKIHGPYSAKELVSAGVSLAAQGAAGRGFAALDIGPSGKLLEPFGDLSFDEAYDAFAEMAVAGEQAGADLALIETMSDTYEIKAAVLAVKENTSLPIFATMTFDEKGQLLTGGSVQAAAILLEGLGVDAMGFNCGLGPVQMKELVRELTAFTSIPIMVNPNAGLPRSENGKTYFDVGPLEYAEHMVDIANMGASVMGGCCGTRPEHIGAMVFACRNINWAKPCPARKSYISSYAHAVSLGPDPKVIGERLNPTGRPAMQQALAEGDYGYMLPMALEQQRHGAHIIDVNAGMPGIDEVAALSRLVTEVQAVTDLPLQIDTTNPEAMDRAMRLYNGKPMVNSVNGKEESMSAVFPIVKKYGGVVVALTIDENGIPDTPEKRLAVAEKIIARAADFGIGKEDLIIDPLVMTVSADQAAPQVTLEALKLIREKTGVNTLLGVSNISFGLPCRQKIDGAFLSAALNAGVNAVFMNTLNDNMMDAFRAFRALFGFDEACQDYISFYAGAAAQPTVHTGQDGLDLSGAVKSGLKAEALQAAKTLLSQGAEPLDIVNGHLIPALDAVGQGFEENTVFLPQLLKSAEAAGSAFEVVKEAMQKKGGVQKKGEKIVVATVKGDIHDIGKNIVKALLENFGFTVIDLGKDVDTEDIVSAAVENQAKLVGLSALMTTTVVNMEAAIQKLKAALPDCKIMVGGAVLSPKYAADIGADRYVKDAMASVNFAREVFKKN